MFIRRFEPKDTDEVVSLWMQCSLEKNGYASGNVVSMGKRLNDDRKYQRWTVSSRA